MNTEWVWWFFALLVVGGGVVAFLAFGRVPEIGAERPDDPATGDGQGEPA